MKDNVDFYRRFVVELPNLMEFRFIVVFFGFAAGSISTWVLSPTTSVSFNLLGGFVVSLLFYILPAFISAEVLHRVGHITGQWAYLVAVMDQVMVFFFALAIAISTSVTAWQIMWLGLALIYITNIFLVVMARGRGGLYVNLLYALLFPGILIGSFHLLIGRLIGIPRTIYLQNSILFLVGAVLLLLTIWMYDFLLRANVEGLSGADFTSVLILGEERALSGGVSTDARHQALHIEQEAGEVLRYTIPWVHPGPVEGFGGGRLTQELIEQDTFFLHVPSNHALDLADPADIDRFRPLPDTDLHETATKLYRVEEGGFTLWGRRYGEKEDGDMIVYIQNRELDDYDPAIINEIKNGYDGLCLIDLHNQDVAGGNPWLQGIDPRAKYLKRAVDRMVGQLQDAEEYPYQAGFFWSQEYCCLVEEVDGQEICLIGIDGNDAPPVLYTVEDVLQSRFEEALVFTTDSHKRLVDLASPRSYDRGELLRAVESAEEQVSTARAGIGERMVENVTVLGEQYSSLIFTLNIMARLVPISLILYYVALVLLVL